MALVDKDATRYRARYQRGQLKCQLYRSTHKGPSRYSADCAISAGICMKREK